MTIMYYTDIFINIFRNTISTNKRIEKNFFLMYINLFSQEKFVNKIIMKVKHEDKFIKSYSQCILIIIHNFNVYI